MAAITPSPPVTCTSSAAARSVLAWMREGWSCCRGTTSPCPRSAQSPEHPTLPHRTLSWNHQVLPKELQGQSGTSREKGFLKPPETPAHLFLTDWADFGRPVSEFGFPLLGPLEFAVTKPLSCQKKAKSLLRTFLSLVLSFRWYTRHVFCPLFVM